LLFLKGLALLKGTDLQVDYQFHNGFLTSGFRIYIEKNKKIIPLRLSEDEALIK